MRRAGGFGVFAAEDEQGPEVRFNGAELWAALEALQGFWVPKLAILTDSQYPHTMAHTALPPYSFTHVSFMASCGHHCHLHPYKNVVLRGERPRTPQRGGGGAKRHREHPPLGMQSKCKRLEGARWSSTAEWERNAHSRHRGSSLGEVMAMAARGTFFRRLMRQ